MTSNIYEASRQWATRPADERYWTLPEMLEAAKRVMSASHETVADIRAAEVVPAEEDASDIRIRFRRAGVEQPLRFTNFSFAQICARVGAPASYLAELPPEIVCRLLNWGLQKRIATDASSLFVLGIWGDGFPASVRAVTTAKYSRIWNADCLRLISRIAEDEGLRVPPARPAPGVAGLPVRKATAEDVLQSSRTGLSVREGDLIAPAGLYMSDRDMFVFLIDDARPLDSGNGPLYRGVIFRNSETGAASLSMTAFLYESVCGNHIIWNASGVSEFRIRHVGLSAQWRAHGMIDDFCRRFFRASTEKEAKAILAARNTLIGDGSRNAVVEKLFEKRLLSRREAEEAYSLALRHEYVHRCRPGSVWGMVCGITRLSQSLPHADRRAELDRAAGKLLASVA